MPRKVLLMALSPLMPATTPYHVSPTPFDGYRKHPRRLPRTMLLPHGAYCYVHISMAYATWEDQTLFSQACFNTT